MTQSELIKSLQEEIARLRERVAVLEAKPSQVVIPTLYPMQPYYSPPMHAPSTPHITCGGVRTDIYC